MELEAIEAALVALYRVVDRVGAKTARKIFKRYDKDGSGELSKEELAKWNDSRKSPDDKIEFESDNDIITQQELEDHLGEKSKETLALVVERFQTGDLKKGFVQKTIMQAGHRLFTALKLAENVKGREEFKAKIAASYDDETPDIDGMMKLLSMSDIDAKTKEALLGSIMTFFNTLNHYTDKKTDVLLAKEDADNSGFLSKEEISDDTNLDFDAIDDNASGFISENECRDYYQVQQKLKVKDVFESNGSFEDKEVQDAYEDLSRMLEKTDQTEMKISLVANYMELEHVFDVDAMIDKYRGIVDDLELPETLKKSERQELNRSKKELELDYQKKMVEFQKEFTELEEQKRDLATKHMDELEKFNADMKTLIGDKTEMEDELRTTTDKLKKCITKFQADDKVVADKVAGVENQVDETKKRKDEYEKSYYDNFLGTKLLHESSFRARKA